MVNNKTLTLLQKADLAMTDLTSGGGALANEQSARFVRKVMEAPTMIREVRVVEMRTPSREINRIGLGSRILKPAVENTALAVGDRSKPAFDKITLTTKEVIAEVRIPYAVMEDAIERASLGNYRESGSPNLSGGVRDTVVDLIAERAAVDLEELAIRGDTASGDTYLALNDGWGKLVTANVVNLASAKISKKYLADALRAMPDRFKREMGRMRFYLPQNPVIDYRETITDRQTGLGDNQLQNGGPLWGMGVPLVGVDMMLAATGLLTDPRNLIFGIQRQVNMEFDKDIQTRQYIIVLTARVDFKIEETNAVVKLTNIG